MRGISHDLRNVLLAASSYAYLLMEEMDDPAARRHAEQVGAAVEHAGRLVDELAVCSTATESLDASPVDVGAEVTDLYPLLAAIAGSGRLVELDVEPGCCAAVRRVDLSRILANVVSNARNAGASVVELTVDRSVLPHRDETMIPGVGPGDYVRVAVADDGPGLPPGTDAASRMPLTGGPPWRDHGVGLVLVRCLVERNGGALQLGAAPAGGASVAAWFPAAA